MQYQATADDGFGMRYSTCNEDNRVELGFLPIDPSSTLMCITGSTGRVLNLLTAAAPPRRLIALDANPVQNHLLELKMAAIRRFDYRRYAEFIGLQPSRQRVRQLAQLERNLSPAARAFWARQVGRVERGVLFEGRFERFYRLNHLVIRLCFRSALRKLRACRTLEEQQRLYREEWDGRLWRALLALHSSDWMYRRVLNDPIFFDHAQEHGSAWQVRLRYVSQISERMAMRTLVHENPMFSLLLCGRYDFVSPQHLPPNLRESQFETLKSRIDRIEIVTATTDQYFRTPSLPPIDGFSLADIGNCLSPEAYDCLVSDVIRVSAPGARFVLRHSYGERFIRSPENLERVRRDAELERRMADEEQTFAYTFTLGQVLPEARR